MLHDGLLTFAKMGAMTLHGPHLRTGEKRGEAQRQRMSSRTQAYHPHNLSVSGGGVPTDQVAWKSMTEILPSVATERK